MNNINIDLSLNDVREYYNKKENKYKNINKIEVIDLSDSDVLEDNNLIFQSKIENISPFKCCDIVNLKNVIVKQMLKLKVWS